jgi:hypothetical protein
VDEAEPYRIGHAISAWFEVLTAGKYFERAKRFVEMSKGYDHDWAKAYCYSLGQAGHFDKLIENSQQIFDPVDRCAVLTYVARDAARENDISNADSLCGIAAQMLDREGIPIGRYPVDYPVSSIIDQVAEILDCGAGCGITGCASSPVPATSHNRRLCHYRREPGYTGQPTDPANVCASNSLARLRIPLLGLHATKGEHDAVRDFRPFGRQRAAADSAF